MPAAVLHGTLHPHLFTAIGWLSVFFLLYLLMPLTNGLLRKTLTHPEEVWITSVNGLIGVYFLARILHPSFRTAMACGCAAISGIYFILMLLVRLRCPQDQPVQRSLLLMSLAFLTAAFPFYFQMRALTAAWAIEGTVLAGAGIFYRSRWTQAVGLAASALSIVLLFHQLPMHTGTFRLAFNPDFGIWIFVCMALLGQHLLYRLSPQQSSPAQPPYQRYSVLRFPDGFLPWFAAGMACSLPLESGRRPPRRSFVCPGNHPSDRPADDSASAASALSKQLAMQAVCVPHFLRRNYLYRRKHGAPVQSGIPNLFQQRLRNLLSVYRGLIRRCSPP